MSKGLERKFKHPCWFKGENWTVREFLENAAKCNCIYLGKRISKEQSNILFTPTNYEDVLKCEEGRGFFRLTNEDKEYYLKCKEQLIQS